MGTSLILHCGSQGISRESLAYIPTPEPTDTWRPVPHIDIANLIYREAEWRGYEIISEEYGVNPSGTKMFGVLRFHPDNSPKFAKCIGIRNSHDKSMAVGITAGFSVLVCDNLCFGGETTIHRKHTSGIDIEYLIHQAFDSIAGQYIRLEQNIMRLKNQPVGLNEAKLMIVEAAEQDAIPSCDILNVLNEFYSPSHPEFGEYNYWSLYNSFTETAKKYSFPRADKCYRKIGKLFGLT